MNQLTILQLFCMTCGMTGLQIVNSVVLSNGTPYLLSLGLSKSMTSLVWMAAPVSGTFIQPIVGILSDNSRSKFGRRRPFIFCGAMGAIVSMLLLAWMEDIVRIVPQSKQGQQTSTLILSTLLIYALNISIQPIMLGMRALVVDSSPSDQQARASAWTTYMGGAGNILGNGLGFTNLPRSLHWIVWTQFQFLSTMASLILFISVAVTCSLTPEQPADPQNISQPTGVDALTMVRQLVRAYKHMSSKIRKVCQIQFFAWLAWFPFMFYATSYVSDLYAPQMQSPATATREDSIRIGTLSFLLFAVTALVTNLILPFFIAKSTRSIQIMSDKESSTTSMCRIGSWTLFTIDRTAFRISHAWACSHIIFGIAMFATFVVSSWITGVILVATVGLAWALSTWAPFAIIGEELACCHEGESGAILSLHNIAISVPQVFAAILSSGVFGITRILGAENGISWVLRIGGCFALYAGYLTFHLVKWEFVQMEVI